MPHVKNILDTDNIDSEFTYLSTSCNLILYFYIKLIKTVSRKNMKHLITAITLSMSLFAATIEEKIPQQCQLTYAHTVNMNDFLSKSQIQLTEEKANLGTANDIIGYLSILEGYHNETKAPAAGIYWHQNKAFLYQCAVTLCLGKGISGGVDSLINLSPSEQNTFKEKIASLGAHISSSSDPIALEFVERHTATDTQVSEYLNQVTPLLFNGDTDTAPKFSFNEQQKARNWKEKQCNAEQLDNMINILGTATTNPAILALGAYPSQRRNFIFTELEPTIFYIDRLCLGSEEDTLSPYFVRADLTDISFLTPLAERFYKRFDLITVDWSVTGHFAWNAEHISKFANLLKPGGKFVFDYAERMCASTTDAQPLQRTETMLREIGPDLKKFPFLQFRTTETFMSFDQPRERSVSRTVNNQIKQAMISTYKQYLSAWKSQNFSYFSDLYDIDFQEGIPAYWNTTERPWIAEQHTRNPISHIIITRKS